MKNKQSNFVPVMLFSVEGITDRENISVRASDLCLILSELQHGQVIRDRKDVGSLWPSFLISNVKPDINAKI